MIRDLQKALRNDKGLRQGYVANIAMSFYDASKIYQRHTGRRGSNRKDLWITANAAAEYFIDLLAGTKDKKSKGDGMYKLTTNIVNHLVSAEKEWDSTHKKKSTKSRTKILPIKKVNKNKKK